MADTFGVEFEDVARSFEGDIPDEDRALVEQRIAEAFRLLYGICPVVRVRVENRQVDPDLVADVIIRAVLRPIRDDSPIYKSESENGYSYSKDSLVASGGLWFPEADLTALGCGRAVAFGSTRVAPDPGFARPSRRIARGRWW